jgi:hypothetical protein
MATAKKTTAKKTTAKKKKAPAKKTATVVALCPPSKSASRAGKRLYTYGESSAGRTLATKAKEEKAACQRKKGLAGTPAKRKPSAAQKANTARITQVSTLARKLYTAPTNRLDWIGCTKEATRQLKKAGKI